jgi:hypothetical protein
VGTVIPAVGKASANDIGNELKCKAAVSLSFMLFAAGADQHNEEKRCILIRTVQYLYLLFSTSTHLFVVKRNQMIIILKGLSA